MRKKRRLLVKNKRSRNLMIYSIVGLFVFLGIGYATLSTQLGISGLLHVSRVSCQVNGSLYKVLECEATDGTMAQRYTGAHHDSYSEEPSKEIYYWNPNSSDYSTILNSNNVLFADHCWQIIRTTDTGGVKMIYNGPSENDQCLTTRPTHIGFSSTSNIRYEMDDYYYGTSFTYDSTNQVFSLSGTVTQVAFNSTTGPGLIGKYTCRKTTANGTCTTLYYLKEVTSETTAMSINLGVSSPYYQFGTLPFNMVSNYSSNSLAYNGYMYNTKYYVNNIMLRQYEQMYSYKSLNTSYWYGDDISYDSTTSTYTLVNPFQVASTSDYPTLVGKYTLMSYSSSSQYTIAYYIGGVSGNRFTAMELTGSGDMSSFNAYYTYGDSYIDNGNGTYTITNPTTVDRFHFGQNYENLDNKYLCMSSSSTCGVLYKSFSPTLSNFAYLEAFNNIKFSHSASFDGTKYILDNNSSVSFWDFTDSTNISLLTNAHYTCWNASGECESVSYIFYESAPSIPDLFYYIDLENGVNGVEAFNLMLYDDNVNLIDSSIKYGIDLWYQLYLLPGNYGTFLEDIIFCNDRSSSNLGGWDPDGNLSSGIYFSQLTSFNCPNETDQFSVSNNKAKLNYKIGLFTYAEMDIFRNINFLKTGRTYWLLTPDHSSITDEWVHTVYGEGYTNSTVIDSNNGVRPAISLKPGIQFTSGDGSREYPYVIDTN